MNRPTEAIMEEEEINYPDHYELTDEWDEEEE